MTSVQLPDELVRELMAFTGQQTPEAALKQAANEFLKEQRQRQRRILEHAGTFDIDPTFDYKAQRRVP